MAIKWDLDKVFAFVVFAVAVVYIFTKLVTFGADWTDITFNSSFIESGDVWTILIAVIVLIMVGSTVFKYSLGTFGGKDVGKLIVVAVVIIVAMMILKETLGIDILGFMHSALP